jgi:hypothetical protein
VKRHYPIFKSIVVVDGGDSWDYDYVASPGEKWRNKNKKFDKMLAKSLAHDITANKNHFAQRVIEELKEHGDFRAITTWESWELQVMQGPNEVANLNPNLTGRIQFRYYLHFRCFN